MFRKQEGVIFDGRENVWGHTVYLDNDKREDREDGSFWPCDGHLSPRPEVGDRVVVEFKHGPVICTFTKITSFRDPPDQFLGEVRGDGYWYGELKITRTEGIAFEIKAHAVQRGRDG